MKEKLKDITVSFEITVKEWEGKFIGECAEMPGLVVSGKNHGEVVKNIKAAIPLYLRYVPKESFIPVFDSPSTPIIYDFQEFNGKLYACTSKDSVVRSVTGDVGAWEQLSIANIFSPYFNPPVGRTKSSGDEQLGDYTPQVYCLKSFNDLGTPKLFCGTNANGGIYETVDGEKWSLSFNSGESRIHCIEAFKGRLFAGTSTEGKVYGYNGSHWSVSLTTPELAVACFGLFRDYLYAGTYPNGMIYRTSDGLNWQKVFDTNQSFINDFYVYQNRLYVSTSKATGGLIFMTEDGTNWVENFFSEKDVNFYKFASFANNLYTGSGDNGRIYKTADGKKWELAFQTDEEDIRAITVFNGYLYFGSSPKGRIFRTTISNTPPPSVHEVKISEITSHSAVITWDTDREAKTIMEYGTDETYGNNIVNEIKSVKHRITLNNLKSLTEYSFRILTYTDIGSFSGVADNYKFTTTAAVTPVLSSKTHPEQNRWYNSADAEIFWGVHADVKNYLYLVDRNPETKPAPDKCQSTVKESVTLKNLEEGIWYCHVMIEDKAGNVSPEVSHFTIKVDTAALPPEVTSSTHADSSKWYNNNMPVLRWEAPEDLSGIEGYYYVIDEVPGTVPNEKTGAYTEEAHIKTMPLEEGVKYFHVVSKDKAGNTGTKAFHFRVNIDTQVAPPLVTSRTHPDEKSWYSAREPEAHFAKPHDLSGVEGFFYSLDAKPDTDPHESEWVYTASSDVKLPAKNDGTWYLHVKSKDAAGNISKETAHYRFNVDTQAMPPNISSVTHPDTHKWYNIKKAQFKIGQPDDLSGIDGYYYVIDNSEKTTPDDTGTWTDKDTIFSGDLKDAGWFIHVVTKDKAGNTGKSASHYRFNIDTVSKPPKLMSKTHRDEDMWYSNSIPELHWDSPEDLSGIEGYYYCCDQKNNTVPSRETAEWTTSNQVTLQRLSDGIWFFHIISKDNAGNTGWEASHFRIKIDTAVEAPKVSSPTHPDETKWYNIPLIKLGWTVPQDLSKVKQFHYLFSREKHMKLLPEMTITTDKREVEIQVDSEGTYYFHILSEDNAGNTGEEPEIFAVNVDLKAEPPEIFSPTHPNHDRFYCEKNPVFNLEQSSDLSGVDGFYYKVDKTPDNMPDKKTGKFTKESTVKIAEPLDDGDWYFHAVLKDLAGNIGAEASHYRLKIETNPPDVHLKELKKFVNSESFEVEWDGEDRESGIYGFLVEYKEGDKGKWKVWLKETKTMKAVFKGEDGITYYFRVKARDNAGNWSEYYEVDSAKVTIDVSPPSQVTQVVARPSKDGEISLEWNKVTDSVSGLDYFRVYRSSVSGQLGMQICDDGVVADTKFTDSSPDLEDGIIYYYTIRGVDKVGNERESGNKQVLAICDRYAMPPVVRSSTHPMQEQWYATKEIKLNWETPQDATKITGYYYIFDQIPATVPEARNGTWYTDNEISFPQTSDGTWYLHIVSKDEAGNISEEATHFQINIDTTRPKPPVVSSITHADFNRWYNNNSPSFSWTTPPDPAGIEGYYYIFNQIRDTVPDVSTASWTRGTMASFVDVPDGAWYLHVIAKDTAGNISEEASHFQINAAMTPPPPVVYSPTHPDENKWYREKNLKIQWKAMSYVNDIIGFYYVLDNFEKTVPTPKNSKTMDTNAGPVEIKDGVWYFHIVSVDREGVIGKTAAHFRARVKTKVSIKGAVTQSNGIMPLSGATVEVLQEDGISLGVGISDKDGNYEIDNLPVAKVKVKVLGKNLPPQIIEDIELRSDEPEKVLNISSEIFALYDEGNDRIIFNYFIPENSAVNIKVYNESGKIVTALDEKKKGKAYNNSFWSTAEAEDGIYLYQVTAKGEVSQKITRYGIRKIKKEKKN